MIRFYDEKNYGHFVQVLSLMEKLLQRLLYKRNLERHGENIKMVLKVLCCFKFVVDIMIHSLTGCCHLKRGRFKCVNKLINLKGGSGGLALCWGIGLDHLVKLGILLM